MGIPMHNIMKWKGSSDGIRLTTNNQACMLIILPKQIADNNATHIPSHQRRPLIS